MTVAQTLKIGRANLEAFGSQEAATVHQEYIRGSVARLPTHLHERRHSTQAQQPAREVEASMDPGPRDNSPVHLRDRWDQTTVGLQNYWSR